MEAKEIFETEDLLVPKEVYFSREIFKGFATQMNTEVEGRVTLVIDLTDSETVRIRTPDGLAAALPNSGVIRCANGQVTVRRKDIEANGGTLKIDVGGVWVSVRVSEQLGGEDQSRDEEAAGLAKASP